MTSKSYNMNHDDGTVCAPGTGTESGCMMNLGKATVIRQPNAARIAVKPIPPSLSLSGCWLR